MATLKYSKKNAIEFIRELEELVLTRVQNLPVVQGKLQTHPKLAKAAALGEELGLGPEVKKQLANILGPASLTLANKVVRSASKAMATQKSRAALSTAVRSIFKNQEASALKKYEPPPIPKLKTTGSNPLIFGSLNDIIQNTSRTLEGAKLDYSKALSKDLRAMENKIMSEIAAKGTIDDAVAQSIKIHAELNSIYKENFMATNRRQVQRGYRVAMNSVKEEFSSMGIPLAFGKTDTALINQLFGSTMDGLESLSLKYLDDVSTAIRTGIISGTKDTAIMTNVRKLLSGGVDGAGNSLASHSRVLVHDGIMGAQRRLTVKKAREAKMRYFMWAGSVIASSRPMCSSNSGRVFTEFELNEMDLYAWQGKSGSVWTSLGGFHCRHHLVPVSDTMAGKIRDEFGDVFPFQNYYANKGKAIPPSGKTKLNPNTYQDNLRSLFNFGKTLLEIPGVKEGLESYALYYGKGLWNKIDFAKLTRNRRKKAWRKDVGKAAYDAIAPLVPQEFWLKSFNVSEYVTPYVNRITATAESALSFAQYEVDALTSILVDLRKTVDYYHPLIGDAYPKARDAWTLVRSNRVKLSTVRASIRDLQKRNASVRKKVNKGVSASKTADKILEAVKKHYPDLDEYNELVKAHKPALDNFLKTTRKGSLAASKVLTASNKVLTEIYKDWTKVINVVELPYSPIKFLENQIVKVENALEKATQAVAGFKKDANDLHAYLRKMAYPIDESLASQTHREFDLHLDKIAGEYYYNVTKATADEVFTGLDEAFMKMKRVSVVEVRPVVTKNIPYVPVDNSSILRKFAGGTDLIKYVDDLHYKNGIRDVADAYGIDVPKGTSVRDIRPQILEAAGLSTDRKVYKPIAISGQEVIDTRNSGRLFHGSSSAIEKVRDDVYTSQNIYGQGFYTTDAVDVSGGYAKKGKGLDNVIYEVFPDANIKIKNLEDPLTSDFIDWTKKTKIPLLEDAIEDNPGNLRELFDNIRGLSADYAASQDTVQEYFDAIQTFYSSKGFQAFEHLGGLNTGTLPHTVRIYFPGADVRIVKAELSNFIVPIRTSPISVDGSIPIVKELSKTSANKAALDVAKTAGGHKIPNNILSDLKAWGISVDEFESLGDRIIESSSVGMRFSVKDGDGLAKHLIRDGEFKNLFQSSPDSLFALKGNLRDQWEDNLSGGAYGKSKRYKSLDDKSTLSPGLADERPSYGFLFGGGKTKSASAHGEVIAEFKDDVSKSSSLSVTDSSYLTPTSAAEWGKLGTFADPAPVHSRLHSFLKNNPGDEAGSLKSLLKKDPQEAVNDLVGNGYVEAQVHSSGALDLSTVKKLWIDKDALEQFTLNKKEFKKAVSEAQKNVKLLSEKYEIPWGYLGETKEYLPSTSPFKDAVGGIVKDFKIRCGSPCELDIVTSSPEAVAKALKDEQIAWAKGLRYKFLGKVDTTLDDFNPATFFAEMGYEKEIVDDVTELFKMLSVDSVTSKLSPVSRLFEEAFRGISTTLGVRADAMDNAIRSYMSIERSEIFNKLKKVSMKDTDINLTYLTKGAIAEAKLVTKGDLLKLESDGIHVLKSIGSSKYLVIDFKRIELPNEPHGKWAYTTFKEVSTTLNDLVKKHAYIANLNDSDLIGAEIRILNDFDLTKFISQKATRSSTQAFAEASLALDNGYDYLVDPAIIRIVKGVESRLEKKAAELISVEQVAKDFIEAKVKSAPAATSYPDRVLVPVKTTTTNKAVVKDLNEIASNPKTSTIVDDFNDLGIKFGNVNELAARISSETTVGIRQPFGSNSSTSAALLKDGKLKNQYQLGEDVTSSGFVSPGKLGSRDNWEEMSFGGRYQSNGKYQDLKDGDLFPPEVANERPIYGYLFSSADETGASSYGNVVFEIDPSIKKVTTMTVRDSSAAHMDMLETYGEVGTFANPAPIISRLYEYISEHPELSGKEWMAKFKKMDTPSLLTHIEQPALLNDYIETQIHNSGALDFSSVKKLWVDRKLVLQSEIGSNTPELLIVEKQVQAISEKYGIPWGYLGDVSEPVVAQTLDTNLVHPRIVTSNTFYMGTPSPVKVIGDIREGHRGYFMTNDIAVAKTYTNGTDNIVELRPKDGVKIFDHTDPKMVDELVDEIMLKFPERNEQWTRDSIGRGNWAFFEKQQITYILEDLGYAGNTQTESSSDIVIRMFKKKDFEIITPPATPEIPDGLITDIKERKIAFKLTADAQRGDPEQFMVDAQAALGGSNYSFVIEHVGDLTHRMSDLGGFGEFNNLIVIDKVTKTRKMLESGYGFEKELLEQLKSNGVDKSVLDRVGLKYAEAHKKVPVYNDLQFAAREAAVAVGEQRYDDAIKYLKEIEKTFDDDTYVAKVSKLDSNYVVTTPTKKIVVDLPPANKIDGDVLLDASGDPLVVYHGTGVDIDKFDTSKTGASWFSDSPEYAGEYAYAASGSPKIYPAYLNLNNPADLGFRDSKTLVKLDDVISRTQTAVLDAYENKAITKEVAKEISSSLQFIPKNDQFKEVWEWVQDEKIVIDSLKRSGYDGITAREGLHGEYKTYGVFNADQIKSVFASKGAVVDLGPPVKFVPDSAAAKHVAKSMDNESSEVFGAIQPPVETLQTAFHQTGPEAASAIIDGNFKSLNLISRKAGSEVYENDGADWVYFGANKEASQLAAVSDGIVFEVDLSSMIDKTAYFPEMENGLLMVYKKASRFTIRNVTALDDTPEALAVVAKWENELKPTLVKAGKLNVVPERVTSLDYFSDTSLKNFNKLIFKDRSIRTEVPIEFFLSMAEEGKDTIKTERVAELIKKGTKFDDLPILQFNDKGQIVGHEGRHRARALQEAGYTTMPVDVRSSTIRWSEQSYPDSFDYVEKWPTKITSQDGKTTVTFPFTRKGLYDDTIVEKLPEVYVSSWKEHNKLPDVVPLTTNNAKALNVTHTAGEITLPKNMLSDLKKWNVDMDKFDQVVAKLKDDSTVGIRVSIDRDETFTNILGSGKLQNIYQYDPSATHALKGYGRDAWEQLLTNDSYSSSVNYKRLSHGDPFPPKVANERPVYGFLFAGNKTESAADYGEVIFEFGDDVKRVSSLTRDDSSFLKAASLEEFGEVGTFGNPTPVSQRLYEMLEAHKTKSNKYLDSLLDMDSQDILNELLFEQAYIEAQVHSSGALDLSKATKIWVDRDALLALNIDPSTAAAELARVVDRAEQLSARLGVPWGYLGETAQHVSVDYVPTWKRPVKLVSTPEQKEIVNSLNDFVSTMPSDYGKFFTDEGISISSLDSFIDSIMTTSVPGVRIPLTGKDDVFWKSLKSEGQLKNQFQVVSGGKVDFDDYDFPVKGSERDEWEGILSKNLYTSGKAYDDIPQGELLTKELADERPIYGFLFTKEETSSARDYGPVIVEYGDDIKPISTLTFDDSSQVADPFKYYGEGGTWENPAALKGKIREYLGYWAGEGNWKGTFDELASMTPQEALEELVRGEYVEIQVHNKGGLNISNATKLWIDKDSYTDNLAAVVKQVEELSELYSIPWGYLGETAQHVPGTLKVKSKTKKKIKL